MKGQLHPIAQAHVAYLANMLDVPIKFSTDPTTWSAEGSQFFGITATGEQHLVGTAWDGITIPKLRSDFAYAVALHELGHVACGEHEARAWFWAYEMALYWSPLMWMTASRALMSYALKYPDVYPPDVALAFCSKLVLKGGSK